MIVACVLRSGGDYDAEDVARLQEGVLRHLPGARFVCLSDCPVPCERIPLQHDWPGWWSKMELWSPRIAEDVLFFDLDTIIVGDLADLAAVTGPVIMRDVYRPDGLQSSVMHIPGGGWKHGAWELFRAYPQRFIREYGRRGDQGFLEDHTGPWRRFQDICPGQVVSYKVHVRDSGILPAGARVVAFHGKPRPRSLNWQIP